MPKIDTRSQLAKDLHSLLCFEYRRYRWFSPEFTMSEESFAAIPKVGASLSKIEALQGNWSHGFLSEAKTQLKAPKSKIFGELSLHFEAGEPRIVTSPNLRRNERVFIVLDVESYIERDGTRKKSGEYRFAKLLFVIEDPGTVSGIWVERDWVEREIEMERGDYYGGDLITHSAVFLCFDKKEHFSECTEKTELSIFGERSLTSEYYSAFSDDLYCEEDMQFDDVPFSPKLYLAPGTNVVKYMNTTDTDGATDLKISREPDNDIWE